MWYRIFLPGLLPQVDRVLYLDSDTLVVDSLHPLWDQALDAYVAAVPNVFEPQYADRPRQLGLPAEQTYFNSGVLLFNLTQMRAANCTEQIVSYARHESLLWPDQDALNVVLGSRRVDLHPRWNCMNSLFLFPQARDVFGADAVREACANPAIVHFEGPELAKPWHYLSKHPFRADYRRHRAATPWPHFDVEGRTRTNKLLRPLPTRSAIVVLTRLARAKEATKQLVARVNNRR
jgi:lipopolysaccharide biosynthesis glycosyltransferase